MTSLSHNVRVLLLAIVVTPQLQGFTIPFTNVQTETLWADFKALVTGTKREEVSKQYPIPPQTAIEIANISGDIKVSSWKNNAVMLRAVKEASSEEALAKTHCRVNHAEASKVFTISTEQPEGNTTTVAYELVVPHDARIRCTNSSQGSIKIKGISGTIFASTPSGNIKLYHTTGNMEAQTERGDVKIKLDSFSNDSSLLIKIGTGSAVLSLPKEIDARLEAKTRNGSITCELPITLDPITTSLTSATRKQMAREAYGTIGSEEGGPITIDIHKGSVQISE